jgi:DpnII restriction endonuclease
MKSLKIQARRSFGEAQLAADANLYLADSVNYSRMIAFVWDNSRRTEHHAELLQGLRKIPGIVDTAIVLRPGGWT